MLASTIEQKMQVQKLAVTIPTTYAHALFAYHLRQNVTSRSTIDTVCRMVKT